MSDFPFPISYAEHLLYGGHQIPNLFALEKRMNLNQQPDPDAPCVTSYQTIVTKVTTPVIVSRDEKGAEARVFFMPGGTVGDAVRVPQSAHGRLDFVELTYTKFEPLP